MKAFLILQISLIAIFTLAAHLLVGSHAAFSFFVGSLFALFNIIFFALITRRIFTKKSVATTLLLIIFKYSILGISLYLIVANNMLNMMWFVIGLSILVPSAIGYIFIMAKQNKADEKDSHGSL